MNHRPEEAKPKPVPLVCTKDPYREPSTPRKIKQIQFGVQTPQEIARCAVLPVHERALYKMPERTPHANGVLDRRLGISNKNAACDTCGQKLADCAGHFGYIKLELPVFHIGYFKNTVQLLQCICKTCSRVLMPEEDRRLWLRRFRNPRVERSQREGMFKKVIDRCKRSKQCPHCGEYNGTVKKVSGVLKITHEKYLKNDKLMDDLKKDMQNAMKYNEAISPLLSKLAVDLQPLKVMALFERIPDADLDMLDLVCRPETLIVSHIAVPPVCIRPSVEMDGASNEDDITMKLMQIVEVNNGLRQGLESGLPIANVMENWEYLQATCSMLINSDLPGLPLQFQPVGRPLRGFVQRLKGKTGRFRGNLSGKRVDFSGRTVISPDPNLAINQVCVPQHMAVVLTFPDRVTPHNIAKLRKRAFEPKLIEGKAIQLHPLVCTAFNADFDGDQMAVHVPLSIEAQLEARALMMSSNNILSPANGEPIIVPTQDVVLGLYYMTRELINVKGGGMVFSGIAEVRRAYDNRAVELHAKVKVRMKLVNIAEDGTRTNVPEGLPFELANTELTKDLIFVNVEMAERIYSKQGEHMCPLDGYVAFRNSQLLCGRIGKVVLGGVKGGLFGTLNSDYSPQAAAAVMSRLAKMAARHMGNRGFSIGIDDVTPKPLLNSAKGSMVEAGYAQCEQYITEYKKGVLALQTGSDREQSLETSLTGVLNGIREAAGKICMDTLHWHNSPLIMSQCGSKGSPINIAQMVACVGQQSVGGKRAFNGFKDRTLPHYPRGDKTPAGKGFVANSFYSGLTATEFWFHTMGGREGLVDTAVKTAETGYMSRRLMKALEDLYTHYDTTVRNAAGGIVQLTYGEDGMDPLVMEGLQGKPVDMDKLLAKIRATTRRQPLAEGGATEVPLPALMATSIASALSVKNLKEESGWCSKLFRDQLTAFLGNRWLALYKAARTRLGLEESTRGDSVLEYVSGLEGLTPTQLAGFMAVLLTKYNSKRQDPGSTVGAIGAQSIGEPGTQMTLKTFHFAGVASMNVTQGVPRIKEIINGAKNITTPIITGAPMTTESIPLSFAVLLGTVRHERMGIRAARLVVTALEKTLLGQVARHIRVVLKPGKGSDSAMQGDAHITIRLDMQAIYEAQLDIDAHTVKWAILRHPRIKLKETMVKAVAMDKVCLNVADDDKAALMFSLQALLHVLPMVIVSGIPTVERGVVAQQKDGTYKILLEGTNLRQAMATAGVDGEQTKTNHVWEVEKFLGIEAARSQIMGEIQHTMGSHGMSIDDRHMMLLADCMTYRGEVLGITRFGIAKMKDSVLHTASFEKTADHLFDAAIHGRIDDVVGVSESIIMGIPMPVGTGLFKIRQNVGEYENLVQRAMPVLAPAVETPATRAAAKAAVAAATAAVSAATVAATATAAVSQAIALDTEGLHLPPVAGIVATERRPLTTCAHSSTAAVACRLGTLCLAPGQSVAAGGVERILAPHTAGPPSLTPHSM
ncbi:MAG: hypothetical protein WDW38_001506 [Sanguina aurantia]